MSPRIARSELKSYPYIHVCARGNREQAIFVHDADRVRYLRSLDKYRNVYKCQLYAFCLMSNHVHLLFSVPSLNTLSKVIHDAHTSYAVHFNARYKVKGHLFQDRYVSWVIRDEKHLLRAKDYIENNPVKARMVSYKHLYRWSSAYKHIGDEPFITVETVKSC